MHPLQSFRSIRSGQGACIHMHPRKRVQGRCEWARRQSGALLETHGRGKVRDMAVRAETDAERAVVDARILAVVKSGVTRSETIRETAQMYEAEVERALRRMRIAKKIMFTPGVGWEVFSRRRLA